MRRARPLGARLGLRRGLPVGLLLALALSGCVGVPSSGVGTVGQDDSNPADAFVHMRAPGPAPGLSPLAVVNRFLAASSGFDEEFATARSFLDPVVAGTWRPSSSQLVFDSLVPSDGSDEDSADQQVTGSLVARIDAEGRFVALAQPQKITLRFHLSRSGSSTAPSWQISTLSSTGSGGPATLAAAGALLDRKAAQRVLAPLTVWWPSWSRRSLVPEPLLLPRGTAGVDGRTLPQMLLDRLVAGPDHQLAGAVAPTAVRAGTSLTVTIRANGTAAVSADDDGGSDGPARDALLGAVARTLRQDGLGIDRVLWGTGMRDIGDADARFDDAGRPETRVLAVNADGQAVQVPLPTTSSPSPTPTPSPSSSPTAVVPALVPALKRFGVRFPVQARDGGRVAALSSDRRRLIVTETSGGAAVALSLGPGRILGAPSIDSAGRVWSLDSAAQQVYVLLPDARSATPVELPRLPVAGYEVSQVEPAPDGSRLALVLHRDQAADLVMVSTVQVSGADVPPAGQPRLGAPVPLAGVALSSFLPGAGSGRVEVRDIDWVDPLRVGLLLTGQPTTFVQVRLGQLATPAKGTGTPLPNAAQVALAGTDQLVYQEDVPSTGRPALPSLKTARNVLLGANLRDPSFAP